MTRRALLRARGLGGGGGGSGYISPGATVVAFATGVHPGNGQVTVTYTPGI